MILHDMMKYFTLTLSEPTCVSNPSCCVIETQPVKSLRLLSTQKDLIYFSTCKSLLSPPPLCRLNQRPLLCSARGNPNASTPLLDPTTR